MAHWNPRDQRSDQRNDNYRERIRRNYEDVEFANQPDSDRRDYERDVLGYRSGNSDARMSGDNRYTADREDFRRGRYRTEPTYEQMYDTATRDYAGYGDNGSQWRQTVDRDRSSTGNQYNSGHDLAPDEFRRGVREYNEVYGARGVQSRPSDYDRNRSEIYGGRPEARGYRADDAALGFGPHRGKGPKDYKRSDERIREDVNDRLTDDHDLDASSITVAVKDSEVTLSGSVNSKRDKRRAEDIADFVSGVSHVQNNLRCNGAAMNAGTGFTTGIESASGTTSATNVTTATASARTPVGPAGSDLRPGANGSSFG